ncbi:MAG: 2-amino-4-hydroxy-6-hydroxymethyldihydropteridine diphosphokinase [Methylobacteriaceae bacterium]|jgi:2-amino-4-hydroxy-6-hydroxymethyldihydropteridine diphosphokinase|nr:2-amino-4-hydroxy-6-hydroxymethyldihydropteridine diphosphokinase [Methylobacteriaceae bacterium]
MQSSAPDAIAPAPIGLGFGSNIGDPAANVTRALEEIEARGIARITACSSLWRTAPWGYTEQEDFANLCALAGTRLSPAELLSALKKLETDLGRTAGLRWGPRVIDIDILFYDDLTSADADLTLPHRELFRRAFVLVPLAEIAPDLMIAGRKIGEAVREIDRTGIAKWNAK